MRKTILFIVLITIFGVFVGWKLKNIDISNINPSKPVGNETVLYTAGKNDDSQRGIEHTEDVYPIAYKIKQISAGKNHTLALTNDGKVLSWGDNDSGQLGRKTKIDHDGKIDFIPNLDNISKISAKNEYSVALKNDGTVWTWGSNFTGSLGTGDNNDRSTPTKVIGIEDIIDISTGNKFVLALKKDGTVWGWGASCNEKNKIESVKLLNKAGSNVTQIHGGYYDINSPGDGTYDHSEDCLNEDTVGIKSTVPKEIDPDIKDIIQISTGYGHGMMLNKNGEVYAFGCNLYGQIGNGNFDNIKNNSKPRKIKNLPKISRISAGFRHSMAMTSAGNVFVWGIDSRIDNKSSNTFNQNTPIFKKLPNKIVNIVDGHDYSTAIDQYGNIWAWGMDNFKLFSATSTASFYKDAVKIGPEINNSNNIGLGTAHIIIGK